MEDYIIVIKKSILRFVDFYNIKTKGGDLSRGSNCFRTQCPRE